MSQRQDPFYNDYTGATTTNNGIKQHPSSGTASQVQVPLPVHLGEPSLQAIRKIVRDAVHRELNPEPLSGEPLHPIINRSHIGVEVAFTDFDGQEYRGVLYPTKVDK